MRLLRCNRFRRAVKLRSSVAFSSSRRECCSRRRSAASARSRNSRTTRCPGFVEPRDANRSQRARSASYTRRETTENRGSWNFLNCLASRLYPQHPSGAVRSGQSRLFSRESTMKFAGARGITRSRMPLIAMLALAAFGMAGCDGDDGKDGAAGTPGAPGTPAQRAQKVLRVPRVLCLASRSRLSRAPCATATTRWRRLTRHMQFGDQGAFANFAVTPDVADLLVSFNVDRRWRAGDDFATFYRAYAWSDGTTRTTLTDEIIARPGRTCSLTTVTAPTASRSSMA